MEAVEKTLLNDVLLVYDGNLTYGTNFVLCTTEVRTTGR
jgi:hypothetical protein